ncbi:MAG: PIN domain-containing protein [Gallionellaceae bacterium]
MIAFFNASALIYLIEGAEPFATSVRAALAQAYEQHPNLGAAVSRLSWLECRVRPMRDNNHSTLAQFDAFFARSDLAWVEINQTVIELATVIRVRHGLRTPDAIQAASCLQLGDEHIFFTGDSGFQRVAGLNVKLLT